MNKVNFDSLKHIKAPQEWLDKAAVISKSTVQKRRDFPIYRIAAVASIVLVSVIGLLIFLFFGDNGSTPVGVRNRGVAATESFAEETTKSGETVPAETIIVLSTDAEGNTVVTYREKPSPTENGTQPTNGRRSPTENAPMPSTSSAPTAPNATDASGQPAPSTECPPAPTEAPAPTVAPPTEPPLTDCRFTVTVKYSPHEEVEEPAAAFEADNPIVFCRMYDASGDLVGSSSSFAEEKRATVVSVNPDDSFVVTYDPLEKGLPITRGRYTYVMVDYFGTELCRGTVEY